jgi:predicted ester cyclase
VVDALAQKVAVRWSATGTQRGPYLGFAPTGKVIELRGIEVLRFEGTLVAERWGEWDGLDLVEQLRG